MSNKYILAIDSFKGCLTSAEAEEAAADGIRGVDKTADIVCLPVSDGGEGMLDAFVSALNGYKVKTNVHDPLMRMIESEYGIVSLKDGKQTAIIETACACGLNLLSCEELNILAATSYGVGEMIVDAWGRGCTEFIIGLGGSAVSDCGIGMLQAMIKKMNKCCFDEIKQTTATFHFILACDVNNPLYGNNGAARIFAPQKGATPAQIELLERKAKTFAMMSAKHFGYDFSQKEGAGAAGGLGYAFMQYLNADMKSGADLLLDIIGFDEITDDAECVITGEGSADRQTLMGKLPYGIMKRAKAQNVPVYLIAGKIEDDDALHEAGFDKLLCINPISTSLNDAMSPDTAKQNIYETVKRMVVG